MDKLRRLLAMLLALALLGAGGVTAMATDIDTDVENGEADLGGGSEPEPEPEPKPEPDDDDDRDSSSHSSRNDRVDITFQTDGEQGTFEDGETEIEISVSEGSTISDSRIPDVFPAEDNDFVGWIVDGDEDAELIDFDSFRPREDTTLVAVYDIPDEMIPFAETPWLNTVDHFAYVVGYAEDGSVRPNANITRAEVATIFFRLLTDEARDTMWSTTNTFTDVPADAWYNTAVSTMAAGGILQGDETGAFRPNANITRAEFAAIASRFMADTDDQAPDPFNDTAGHWAREEINAAAAAGWVNGYEDGSFRPNAYITRAEAMTLVNNVLGRKPDAGHMLSSMKTWTDNPQSAWFYEAVQEATNSHTYDLPEDADYETWTALEENPDWTALESQWAAEHAQQ